MARGKILVVRGGAIGDFILTLPVLSALRQGFPETQLEVLGYPHIAKLALFGGLADNVRAVESRPLATFFTRNGKLSDELSTYFSDFAIIISYLYDPDDIFKTNVARCSKAQFISGLHRPNENESIHATEVFLKPLQQLAIFDADPVPSLTLKAKAKVSNRIAIHAGSGSEKKNWPEEQWGKLLQLLTQSTNANVLLIGGEAEGEKLNRLAQFVPAERLQLAQRLPLTQLAEHLSTCTTFAGHDSGISHLAAALNIPSLILWGETKLEIWRPLSPTTKILNHPDGLNQLPEDLVLRELEQIYKASH